MIKELYNYRNNGLKEIKILIDNSDNGVARLDFNLEEDFDLFTLNSAL